MVAAKPSVIKPPAMRRGRDPVADQHSVATTPKTPTIAEKRAISSNGQRYLRNSNVRNPNNFDENAELPVDSPETTDTEKFYTNLRTSRQKSIQDAKRRLPSGYAIEENDMVDDEFAKLREMAQDARQTKNSLQKWKNKIETLEENLKDQDYAMQDVLNENKELEEKVAKLQRSTKVAEKASESKIVKTRPNLTTTPEQTKLRRTQLKLERELTEAREENEKLREEMTSIRTPPVPSRSQTSQLRKTRIHETDDSSCDFTVPSSDGQRLLVRNKRRRKEAQLERSLMLVQRENEELLAELARCTSKFEKLEDQNHKFDSELTTLREELEMSRRIAHTKRSLLQKEISEETREGMREEMRSELLIELTEKLTIDLNSKLSQEMDQELQRLREIDDQKVRDVQHQVPILENEIDRLRLQLKEKTSAHERAMKDIEVRFRGKTESIINQLYEDRKKEVIDFKQTLDDLSKEHKRVKEQGKKEKEEYGSRLREEVKKEMQKEVQFLADRVSELTKESIELLEKMTEEKEAYGKSIRDELTKEKDDLLDAAAKEKESYAESIRQEMAEEKRQEINEIKTEIEVIQKERDTLKEKIIEGGTFHELAEERKEKLENCKKQLKELEEEKNSLSKKVNELEEELNSVLEKLSSNTEELNTSQSKLEASKIEIVKMKKQKRDLNAKVEQYKSDYAEMSKEVQRIKSHFKYTVLIEYEEKILELENEIRDLEDAVEQARAERAEGGDIISNQHSILEQYKANEKTQHSEIEKLKSELRETMSELESKENRISEMKEIISKKETETDKLIRTVKDLKWTLGSHKSEITRMRKDQESSKETELSKEVYEAKISSLKEELGIHKSRLEHCRCDGKAPNSGDDARPTNEELRDRVSRLNLMLKVAEKNHGKERIRFEVSTKQLNEEISDYKEEIENLKADLSSMKHLLNQPKDKNRQAGDADEVERLKLQNIELREQAANVIANSRKDHSDVVKDMRIRIHKLSTEREQFISKIDALENATTGSKGSSHKENDSARIIRGLKNDLKVSDEEKKQIIKELHKSKLLFKEAIISWRVETRSLKEQIHDLQGTTSPNTVDSNDAVMLLEKNIQKDNPILSQNGSESPLLESIREDSESVQRQSFSRERVTLHDTPPPSDDLFGISEDISSEIERSNHSTTGMQGPEIRDDESTRLSATDSVAFAKQLEISEHSTSIEMRFDTSAANANDQSVSHHSDSVSEIYNSLQVFKGEYEKYTDGKSVGGSSAETSVAANQKDVMVIEKTSRTVATSQKISHAPQPHLDGGDADDMSAASSRRIPKVFKMDTRDDNVGVGSYEESSREINDDHEIKDLRNLLQEEMSKLRIMGSMPKHQLKRSKRQTSPKGFLQYYHYHDHESNQQRQHRKRGHGFSSSPPFDEGLERKNSLPFDEYSKHTWRE